MNTHINYRKLHNAGHTQLQSTPFFRRRLFSCLLIFSCAFIYYLRCQSITLTPNLYAEDGLIFLQSALEHGPWSIFELYAGYSHLLQRIAAITAVNTISPFEYPSFFLCVAWLSFLMPLFAAEWLIRRSIFSPIFRLSYLPYVLHPNAAETYLNLPNSYIFFPLGFILLAYGQVLSQLRSSNNANNLNSIQANILLLPYGIVAALTGPFVAIYTVPLLILLGIKTRQVPLRPQWLTIPIALSSIQIYFSQISTAYPISTTDALMEVFKNIDLLIKWITYNLVCTLIGGEKAYTYLANASSAGRIIAILAVFALLVISMKIIIKKTRNPSIIIIGGLSTMALSISSLVVSLKRGIAFEGLIGYDLGGRFFFWNAIFFISCMMIALTMLVLEQKRRHSINIIFLAIWLLFTIFCYKNNITDRAMPFTYQAQLISLCKSRENKLIQIWPGGSWTLFLKYSQVAAKCDDKTVIPKQIT